MPDRKHTRTGNRIPAGDLCRENGWGKGTVLSAPDWTTGPRVVRDVGPVMVELGNLGHGGSSAFAKTLPAGVEKASS